MPRAAASTTKSRSTATRTLESRARELLTLGALINSTLDLSKVLTNTMQLTKKVLRCQTSSLMLIDPATRELVWEVALGRSGKKLKKAMRLAWGEGIAGWVAQHEKPLCVNDTARDPRVARRADQTSGFQTRAIACVPLLTQGQVIGVLQGINPLGRAGFSPEDMSLLEAVAHHAAVAITNARLHKEALDRQRVTQELETAALIQRQWLPEIAHQQCRIGAGCVNVVARMIPARQVGGDLFEVFWPQEHIIGLAIGDVSGKGTPAALFMAKTLSEFRLQARMTEDPAQTLAALNDSLAANPILGMFVTMAYCRLDLERREIRWACGGHPPILLRQTNGTWGRLNGQSGRPLGVLPQAEYQTNVHPFGPGEAIFMHTDGVTEGRNRQGEEYGYTRLLRHLPARPHPDRTIIDAVLEQWKMFCQNQPLHDDTTMVNAEWVLK